MGKAFVYDGFKISNPIKKVGFEKGIIDAPVREYLSKLSIVPSDKQINAIQNFYKKLSESGIWETIAFCYPMFGSLKDCAIGLKGDKLTIPNGSLYDNGLNLAFATDGVGINKKGIIIKNFGNNEYSGGISLYYNSDYSSYSGDVYCFTKEIDNTEGNDNGCFIGPSWNLNNILFTNLAVDASQPISKGVVCYTKNRSIANTYFNGGNKKESQKGFINNATYLGINTWCNTTNKYHLVNRPLNFLVGSYAYHTEEQVKILSDEITKLKEALFEL